MPPIRRRELLRVLPAAALLANDAAKAAPQTTLDSIELIRVKVNRRGNWLLVRVKTSSGLTGLGEASHGKDENTIALLRRFFDAARGRSAFDVEPLRRAVWPEVDKAGTDGGCAFSAIEQAMFDIQGKALGVPCHDLFGGRLHPRIRHYANINRSTDNRLPEGFAATASRAVAAGFDAIKMASFDGMPRNDAGKRRAHTDRGVACVAAVRQAIGPSRDLLVDGHDNFDLEQGLELARRLEPHKLFWLEEVSPGIPWMAKLNEALRMPTAGGESLIGVKQFLPYIAGKAADIMMPDVKYCGGMLELKKIAAMAEAAGMPCSPHGPASPVGNAAAAHVCASLPNFLILELGFGEVPWRGELVKPEETFEKGYMTMSARPGLGIELNDAIARRYAA